MSAALAFVPYRSTRALRGFNGLGADLTSAGNSTSSYANYAKAIYQAYKGDVVGGAYNAVITYAGAYAAIGNAIANYFNAANRKKAAITQDFLDALVSDAGFGKVLIGKAGWRYLTPDGKRILNPDENARAVALAIYQGADSTTVGNAFKAWLDASSPYNGGFIVVREPHELPSAPPDEKAPSVSVAPPASVTLPTPAPTPFYYTPPSPVPTPAVVTMPAASVPVEASTITAATVPPNQTPALIQQLINQGASQQQAFESALKSLAAQGVHSTPQIKQQVASDVRSASVTQEASSTWLLFGLVALVGVGLISRGLR